MTCNAAAAAPTGEERLRVRPREQSLARRLELLFRQNPLIAELLEILELRVRKRRLRLARRRGFLLPARRDRLRCFRSRLRLRGGGRRRLPRLGDRLPLLLPVVRL